VTLDRGAFTFNLESTQGAINLRGGAALNLNLSDLTAHAQVDILTASNQDMRVGDVTTSTAYLSLRQNGGGDIYSGNLQSGAQILLNAVNSKAFVDGEITAQTFTEIRGNVEMVGEGRSLTDGQRLEILENKTLSATHDLTINTAQPIFIGNIDVGENTLTLNVVGDADRNIATADANNSNNGWNLNTGEMERITADSVIIDGSNTTGVMNLQGDILLDTLEYDLTLTNQQNILAGATNGLTDITLDQGEHLLAMNSTAGDIRLQVGEESLNVGEMSAGGEIHLAAETVTLNLLNSPQFDSIVAETLTFNILSDGPQYIAGDGTEGGWNLSGAEMANINASSVLIDGSHSTGNMHLRGDILLDDLEYDLTLKNRISIVGGEIYHNDITLDRGERTFNLEATQGGIYLSGGGNLNVNLSDLVAEWGVSIITSSNQDLRVGDVTAQLDVIDLRQQGGGDIYTGHLESPENITLTADNGNIAFVDGNITAGTNITLQSDVQMVGENRSLTDGESLTIQAGKTLGAENDLTINTTQPIFDGNIDVGENTLTLNVLGDAERNIATADANNSNNGWNLSAAEMSNITAGSVLIDGSGDTGVMNLLGDILLGTQDEPGLGYNLTLKNQSIIRAGSNYALPDVTLDRGDFTLDLENTAGGIGLVGLGMGIHVSNLTASGSISLNSQNLMTLDGDITSGSNIALQGDLQMVGDHQTLTDSLGLIILADSTLSSLNDLTINTNQPNFSGNIDMGDNTLTINVVGTSARNIAGTGFEGGWNLSGAEMANISAGSVLIDGSGDTGLMNLRGDILLDTLGYDLTLKNQGDIQGGNLQTSDITVDRGEHTFNMESTQGRILLIGEGNLNVNLSDLTAANGVYIFTSSNQDIRVGDVTDQGENIQFRQQGGGDIYTGHLESTGYIGFLTDNGNTAFVDGNMTAGTFLDLNSDVEIVGEGRSLTDGVDLFIYAGKTLSAAHDLTINTTQPYFAGNIDVGENTLTLNVVGNAERNIATADPNFSNNGWNLNTGEMGRINAGSVIIDGSNTTGTMSLRGNILLGTQDEPGLGYNLTLKNLDNLQGGDFFTTDITLDRGDFTFNMESDAHLELGGEAGLNLNLSDLTASNSILIQTLSDQDIRFGNITVNSGSLQLQQNGGGDIYTENLQSGSSMELQTDGGTAFVDGNIASGTTISLVTSVAMVGEGRSLTDGQGVSIFANRTLSAENDLTINTAQPDFAGNIDVGENTLTINVLGNEARNIAGEGTEGGWNLKDTDIESITAGSVLIDGSNTTGVMNLQGDIELDDLGYNLDLINRSNILGGSNNDLPNVTLDRGELAFNLESTEDSIRLSGGADLNINLSDLTAGSQVAVLTSANQSMRIGNVTTNSGNIQLTQLGGNDFYTGNLQSGTSVVLNASGRTVFVDGNITAGSFIQLSSNVEMVGEGRSVTDGNNLTISTNRTLSAENDLTINTAQPVFHGNINVGENTLTLNVVGNAERKIATADGNVSQNGWNLNTGEMGRITAGSVMIDGSDTTGLMGIVGDILLGTQDEPGLGYSLTLKNKEGLFAEGDIALNRGDFNFDLESTDSVVSLWDDEMTVSLSNITAGDSVYIVTDQDIDVAGEINALDEAQLIGNNIQVAGLISADHLGLWGNNAGSSNTPLQAKINTLAGGLDGDLFLNNQGNLAICGNCGLDVEGNVTLNVDGSFTIVNAPLTSNGHVKVAAQGPILSLNGSNLDIQAKEITLTSTHSYIGTNNANQFNVFTTDGPLTLKMSGTNTDGLFGALWGNIFPPPNVPTVNPAIQDRVFWNGQRMRDADPLPPAPSPPPSPNNNNNTFDQAGQKLQQEVPWSPANVIQSAESPPKAPPQPTTDIQDNTNGQGSGDVQIENSSNKNAMENPDGIIIPPQSSPNLTAPDEDEEFSENDPFINNTTP
jgi:hypothetical protein